MPQRSDGTQVSQKDAIKAWSTVARPYLIDAAKAGTTVTYKALANYVRVNPPGVFGDSIPWKDQSHGTTQQVSARAS